MSIRIESCKVDSPRGEIAVYKLINSIGASVTLSALGAGVVSIIVPDKNGEMADVVLGYEDLADYIADGPCAGKTPGRYANRIGGGRLVVDGKVYNLAVNCGPNHLHGGPEGFQNRIWDASAADGKVVFRRRSADGEEGYPGNLDVKVTYTWDDDFVLGIEYEAVTDEPTVVNLTNHTYFNLGGHNAGSALDHMLRLSASRYLEVDKDLTPSGVLLDVEGTPMDFRTAKALRRDIKADFAPLHYGKGYDHCWAIDGWEEDKLCHVATLSHPATGRKVEILSTQPGAQVYTGNWLAGSPHGKDGYEYRDYDCVAIECQGFPDAPNHPGFPSQFLNPGDTYHQTIIYKFNR